MKEALKNIDEVKLQEAFKINEAYRRGEIDIHMANAQMKAHVGSLTPAEIAYIEQYMQEKVDEECVKESLEQMLSVYDGVLKKDENRLPSGHPIANYMLENERIRGVIEEIDDLIERKYIKNVWDETLEKLNEFKVHLSRKQNQLYTALEKKGFDRPTQTMWLYDNEVRDKITGFTKAAKEESLEREHRREAFESMKEHILDLMEKEDSILYPTALELLSEEDFLEMARGDVEIGYCLIEPGDEYGMRANEQNDKSSEKDSGFFKEFNELLSRHNLGGWSEDTPMNVKQGLLSLNQINLIFQHLPVDISYVDENELVAFYSDTKHRVFPRSKGVIGRDVKNCHPANSVHMVEEIIEKFRSGKEDRAEFWIDKGNMFIYILYVAVRDEQGKFKGVMEMMQDCTHIRALQGSRTLLTWNEENVEYREEEAADTGEQIRVLTEDMKLSEILKQYPTLKEYMIAGSDKFQLMKFPMFKFMQNVVTVGKISEKTGIPMEKLQEEFTKYINSL